MAANKGLDGNLLKYGISTSDLHIIESVCQTVDIDPDWLEETVLEPFHTLKTKGEKIEPSDTYKIIKSALKEL